MVTYADLFQLIIAIVGIITLCYNVFHNDNTKK